MEPLQTLQTMVAVALPLEEVVLDLMEEAAQLQQDQHLEMVEMELHLKLDCLEYLLAVAVVVAMVLQEVKLQELVDLAEVELVALAEVTVQLVL